MAFGSSGVPPNSTYKIAQPVTGCRRTYTAKATMRLWIMVLLTLSQTLDTVELLECKTMIFWYRRWLI
jgi:hypothetical protein